MPLAGRTNFQFNLVCESRAENVNHCFLKASNRCSYVADIVISECSLRCSSGCSLVSLAFWHKLEGSEMHLVTSSGPKLHGHSHDQHSSKAARRKDFPSVDRILAKALLVMIVFNLECFSPCLAVFFSTLDLLIRLQKGLVTNSFVCSETNWQLLQKVDEITYVM